MHSLAQRPRQVGISLKHLPRNPSEYFNIDNVPWQRVINSKGMISHRYVRTNQRKTSIVQWVVRLEDGLGLNQIADGNIDKESPGPRSVRRRFFGRRASMCRQIAWGRCMWIWIGMGGFRGCCLVRRVVRITVKVRINPEGWMVSRNLYLYVWTLRWTLECICQDQFYQTNV